MNEDKYLRRNPRVFAHQVEENVWGLYHLDKAETSFADELSMQILRYIDRLDTPRKLINVFAELADDSEKTIDELIRERLDRLCHFGALEIVSSQDNTEVLLIDPPCAERMVGTHGPAKGLCYLSHALQKQGYAAAHILDMRSVSPSLGLEHSAWTAYFARYVCNLKPRVIGITAVSATISNALFIGHLAKMMFPDAFIVLGGPHASYEWQSLLKQNDWLDAIVVGEGEIPFPLLVRRVCMSKPAEIDFSDIKGIAWRGLNGDFSFSGWCHGSDDLDSLGFPDDHIGLLNHKDYDIRYGRIMASRGCPYSCSFCSTATFTGRKVRYRSIENVIEEIDYIREHYRIKSL